MDIYITVVTIIWLPLIVKYYILFMITVTIAKKNVNELNYDSSHRNMDTTSACVANVRNLVVTIIGPYL